LYGPALAPLALPKIVTMIDLNGYPVIPANTLPDHPAGSVGFYPISDLQTYNALAGGILPLGRGYNYIDPITGTEKHGIKGAFSDFLKLRAGGSGFLFAWGSGVTGSGPQIMPANLTGTFAGTNLLLAQTPVAQERPFRSLATADINDTVMRPATLPPTPTPTTGTFAGIPFTYPPAYFNGPLVYADDLGNSYQDPAQARGVALPPPPPPVPPVPPTVLPQFVGDPGLRNPYLALTTPGSLNPRQLPTIPFRRLFEVPDTANATNPPSNAAEFIFDGANYTNLVNQPVRHEQLSANFATIPPNLPTANLFALQTNFVTPGAAAPSAMTNNYLGANPPADRRQHPYYRTEILQKMMNLTTVRTHQFAVWITVGFFEVLNTGTPYLGIADQLGAELGALAGKNIRYRSFFILDRTKAVGFSPTSPIDFRDVVTYRRRIE
jgi:hypothetical protein